MRDQIRQRLIEYAVEALRDIGVAVNETKSKLDLNNSRTYLYINKDYEDGFAKYMDRSVEFVSHVGRGSKTEYANELREAGNNLKVTIMANLGHQNRMLGAFPGNSTRVALMGQLGPALDKLIKRKVEDFELGYIEGKDMTATTNNSVNIIGSQITNSVLEINQSGRDTISKETAQKLEQLIKTEEIKALPEATRLDVLDQVSDLIKELKGPTDTGKVHRGLKRLREFISSVASSSVAEIVAQIAVAYAMAHGLPI